MLLPKHKLDELDYYVAKTHENVGIQKTNEDWYGYQYFNKYADFITLYWKKRRFWGIFPYRPKSTVLQFDRWNKPVDKNTVEVQVNKEYVELKSQLDIWSRQ